MATAKKPSPPKDVTKDASWLGTFFEQIVGDYAHLFGDTLGRSTFVSGLATQMQGLVGKEASIQTLNAISAFFQKEVDALVTKKNLSPAVRNTLRQGVDEIFDALKEIQRANGHVTNKEAMGVLRAVLQRQRTFKAAMMRLEPTEQAELTNRVTAFCSDDEQKRKFRIWRGLIDDTDILRVLLARKPDTEWESYLTLVLGDAESPKALKKAKELAAKAKDAVITAGKKVPQIAGTVKTVANAWDASQAAGMKKTNKGLSKQLAGMRRMRNR